MTETLITNRLIWKSFLIYVLCFSHWRVWKNELILSVELMRYLFLNSFYDCTISGWLNLRKMESKHGPKEERLKKMNRGTKLILLISSCFERVWGDLFFVEHDTTFWWTYSIGYNKTKIEYIRSWKIEKIPRD